LGDRRGIQPVKNLSNVSSNIWRKTEEEMADQDSPGRVVAVYLCHCVMIFKTPVAVDYACEISG